MGNKGGNHGGIQSSDVIISLYKDRSHGLTSREWNKRRINELIQNISLVGEQTKDGDVNGGIKGVEPSMTREHMIVYFDVLIEVF